MQRKCQFLPTIVILFGALLMAACDHSGSNEPTNTLDNSSAADNPQPSGDANGTPQEGAEINLDTLVFPYPELKQVVHLFQECFATHANGADWDHRPLSTLSPAYAQEKWCRGQDATPDCNAPLFAPELLAHRDKQAYAIDLRSKTPSSWPEIHRLEVSALKSPSSTEGDRGIRLDYEIELASGLQQYLITFPHFGEGDVIVEEFKQRSFYNYSLSPGSEGGSEHTITSPQADSELALLLTSPASLRDTLAARYDALLSEIERAINSGEAFKYEYADPKQAARAIPPQKVPLTPEEGRVELEKARTRLGEKKSVVEENAQIFHQLLTDVIGQCGWEV